MTELTWLGHATVRLETPEGNILLIDPWLEGNPSCPDDAKTVDHLDAIFVTHAHFDHLGEAVELAKKHEARVVCNAELGYWFVEQGIPKERVEGMNKGGTIRLDGLSLDVTMTHADHSSGFVGSEPNLYGSDPIGFVIALSDDTSVYHAGDTAVFGDMALIRELYAPTVALLPIGGRFTMGPREAAKAVELLQPETVVPIHFGTFDALPGTAEAFEKELGEAKANLTVLEPGGSL